MTAALTASVLGLNVLVLEKAAVIGGTTSRSAGAVWIPNSRHSKTGDTPEQALAYLRASLGNRMRESMVAAFLRAGPQMIDFLEDNTSVAFRAFAHHPDYLATLEGATLSGRVLEPVPFNGAVLGKHLAALRMPLPEFTLLGGMMVDRIDIG
ncbi:MAG: FAD-binding protein, partial [Hyphomicrobiaceae bacterium]